MDKVILHCDCNSFYASVELLQRPDLRDKPVAVCGDPQARHGLILAKNDIARGFGVRTAETIKSARDKCPQLMLLPAHHSLYASVSARINAIYADFTDMVEPASIDESYLDVTGSQMLFGDGKTIADAIRARIRDEIGITVSVGVSFNKIFAKMGSDYKKPDATTVITRDNYKNLLYPLPVSDMLYVGRSAANLLHAHGIETIGDIARMGEEYMTDLMGKSGTALYRNVVGLGDDVVRMIGSHEQAKSIGNSYTYRRDLTTFDDIDAGLALLCGSVGHRLRAEGLFCKCVTVQIKDSKLNVISRQQRLDAPSNVDDVIYTVAKAIVRRHWREGAPVRMLSVSASDLAPSRGIKQISFFEKETDREARGEGLYSAIDSINARYGDGAVKRGNTVNTDII